MAAVLTVTKAVPLQDGSKRITGTLALDSSYPTGGEAVSITGYERIYDLSGFGSGYAVQWDAANQKALVYYGDNNNASDGPLIEVPNTTDLSALTAIPVTGLAK